MARSLRRPKLMAYLGWLSRCSFEQLGDELRKRNPAGSSQFLSCLFQRQRQDDVCLFRFVTIERTASHTP